MKKIIELAIASAIPLMGVIAVLFVFAPSTAFDFYDVIPGDSHGENSIRSDIGGFVLSFGVITAMFIKSKSRDLLKALMVLTGSISFMRLVSLLTDGFNAWGLGWLGLELLSLTLMYVYMRKFTQPEEREI